MMGNDLRFFQNGRAGKRYPTLGGKKSPGKVDATRKRRRLMVDSTTRKRVGVTGTRRKKGLRQPGKKFEDVNRKGERVEKEHLPAWRRDTEKGEGNVLCREKDIDSHDDFTMKKEEEAF